MVDPTGAERCHELIAEAVDRLGPAVDLLAEAARLAAAENTDQAFTYTNHWRVLAGELPTTLPRLIARLESFLPATDDRSADA